MLLRSALVVAHFVFIVAMLNHLPVLESASLEPLATIRRGETLQDLWRNLHAIKFHIALVTHITSCMPMKIDFETSEMLEELIYDISLECHGALTTLIQQGNLWKGPICFDDIFKTFQLLYTYVTNESAGGKRVFKIRYKRDYSGEENMWGTIEAYKRLLGLIMFNQCDLNADVFSAVEYFRSAIKDFKNTLASGLLVIIIHNESKEAISFNATSEFYRGLIDRIHDLTEKLPSFCEIVLLPGNGFLSKQSSLQECVMSGNGRSDNSHYYRFSRLLDKVVHDTLLQEVQYLTMSLETFENDYDQRSKSQLFPPENSLPQHNGSCVSLYGKIPVTISGVCSAEFLKLADHSELSSTFQNILGWRFQTDSPLSSCQYLCRQNKLAGDLCVQLGEFVKAQFYYRKAMNYYARNDPPIWQASLLVGYSASLHLREIDFHGRQRYLDPRLLSTPLSLFLSSTISSSIDVNGLDLANVKKQDVKFPQTPSSALFRAGQTIQQLKKARAAASIPRCVIEVMYKNADYLVTVSKRNSAIRALDALQNEVIPRGDAFMFERYHVLSNLYVRLGLLHKAGLLQYLLENSLFNLIHTSNSRPSADPTHASRICLSYINRIRSDYLSSPELISAYQLSTTPSGFRRTPCGSSTGVVFVCGLVFSDSRQLGWPMLQRQLLVSVIKKIRKAIEETSETIQRANWKHCTSLLGYMFSLINGWHEDSDPADISRYIEILQHLATAKPADQPSLPEIGDAFLEEKDTSNAIRSSFGSPISSTLHPLVRLVELYVDKMPIVRNIVIPGLPTHSLPSRMSYEALSSIVAIRESSPDSSSKSGSNAYSRRMAFSRQPTFITHPSHISSSDTVDWIANDLGYIEIDFDNPFAIQIEFDKVSFELIEEEATVDSQIIKLESVQIIPGSKPVAEITLKPFSGCIFEQVPLFLNRGNDPESGGYVEKVVLPPHSTRNLFVFTICVPPALAELKTEKWRVRAITYRLITFGGFRVTLPLSDKKGTAEWKLYPSPQDALEENEANVNIINRKNVFKSPSSIRVCPPLPRLCLFAGPCTNAKGEMNIEPDSILDKLATSAYTYAPSLRLASTLNNQETKQSVCNIIIDLHPYEKRWLPIHLFVGANACTCGSSQEHNHSSDCGKQLNLLHISLHTTLSTNKLLQKYDLLLGQFLQIPNVMDVRQKLPMRLTSIPSTQHCRLKDNPNTNGSCGTLWLQADSTAFWDAWYQDPSSSTQILGDQSLLAQLSIELAADVSMAKSTEENWTRVVIGRCVKVGIEIRFLTSVDSPLRIIEPTLMQNPSAYKGSSVDCFLQFKLNKMLTNELTNLLRPTSDCTTYRTELEVSFSWAKQTFIFDGQKTISVATAWETFVSRQSNDGDNNRDEVNSNISKRDALSGLVKVNETDFTKAPDSLGLPLFNLLQIFQLADFPPLAVATRPTDELLLPLPLPHALGRLLELGVDIRWTSRLVVKVNNENYSLPNVRSGRIAPISPLSSSDASPWYFPLLKYPRFIASILWSSRIWLQLVQRFHFSLPVYQKEDCPACRELAAIKDPTPQFASRNRRPIDPSATHVVISTLSKVPLELYGGIEDDEFFNILHGSLARQFSPFVDPSKRECEDLSEQQTNYISESALVEKLEDGLVLHRLWIGLDVFEADEKAKDILSMRPLTEGTVFSLCGSLRGQAGLFVGKPISTDVVEAEPKTPFGSASTQSLKGSVVFMRKGNFFVRGYVHLLPLPFTNASDRFMGTEFKTPPTHLYFGPIKETSHSFLFHRLTLALSKESSLNRQNQVTKDKKTSEFVNTSDGKKLDGANVLGVVQRRGCRPNQRPRDHNLLFGDLGHCKDKMWSV
nr:conserved hypothetical protein [Hymenolepis microstoma]